MLPKYIIKLTLQLKYSPREGNKSKRKSFFEESLKGDHKILYVLYEMMTKLKPTALY